MLKATSPRTKLPIWDLMMKNIYTLKAENGNYLGSLDRDNFQLNILYQEAGSGEKRYLPEGSVQEFRCSFAQPGQIEQSTGSATRWCVRLPGRLHGRQ